MSNIIYLRIVGEQQGVISEGCGSEKSVGNRYQRGHEDEIFAFWLRSDVSSTGRGVNHHGIQFCKTIDKSSPLFTQAINNNERCSLEFIFYRINRYGKWEKYYAIETRGATITSYQMHTRCDVLSEEYITINYDYICCKHLASGTEFSHLVTPENYASLFPATIAPVEKVKETPKKREIVLTIGVFFDGTGNNLLNTNYRMQVCNPESYGLAMRELAEFSQRCMTKQGLGGTGGGSYLNYYTNIHWLNELYHKDAVSQSESINVQRAIYVEGIGTENRKADSLLGMGLGNNDTGVIAKTERAIFLIKDELQSFLSVNNETAICITQFQFDVFGFSRGAAAARHFTNRVYERDPALVNMIKTAFSEVDYQGKPAGEVRFVGLFDTVTAVGGIKDGLDPHDSNNLGVKLALPAGVAKKVFHLTAMHECRYNFCLNSVKEGWPELSLPGAHADIGGGYNPQEEEYVFLTCPRMQIVASDVPVASTRAYRHTAGQAELLSSHPVLAPIIPTGVLKTEADIDDRMPVDRYYNTQKRVAAAVTLQRIVSNDWSKVALRVMYEVAKEAGVVLDDIQDKDSFTYPEELNVLCEKAIMQAKAAITSSDITPFSTAELNIIGRYIHCSANWNAVDYRLKRPVNAAVSPVETFSFVNRPDDNWVRTIYNMSGKTQK